MSVTCSTCRFFEIKNKFCRRHPPAVVIEHRRAYESPTAAMNREKEVTLAKFPVITRPDIDWCGEHRSVEQVIT